MCTVASAVLSHSAMGVRKEERDTYPRHEEHQSARVGAGLQSAHLLYQLCSSHRLLPPQPPSLSGLCMNRSTSCRSLRPFSISARRHCTHKRPQRIHRLGILDRIHEQRQDAPAKLESGQPDGRADVGDDDLRGDEEESVTAESARAVPSPGLQW